MARTAVQLYTLRDVDRPLADLLEAVAAAGFDGVEFAYRVTDEDPNEVAATLADTGLDVAGVHVPIEALEDEFEETVAFYEALGCSDLVVPYLDESHFASQDGIETAVERLAVLRDRLEERGIDLHYHNHDHEFVPLDDDRTGFDAFIESTDIDIELDLGLALLGGEDPVAWLHDLGGRVSLAHVKDVDLETSESVPVGTGDLDVSACASVFRENDGEWLVYEYEGAEPLDTLEGAAATLSAHC